MNVTYSMILLMVLTVLIIYKINLIQSNSYITIEEYSGPIPKVIMQTGPTMESRKEGSKNWRILNPDYDYVFFDNKKCIQFIKEYFDEDILRAFDKLKPGAYKADLFRYCYLYIKGGVYADLDMSPLVSLDEILMPGYDMITVADRGNIGVYQAFIACVPNISLFSEIIDIIVHYTENEIREDRDALCWTGPCLWKELFNLYKPGESIVDGYKIYMYINNITNNVSRNYYEGFFGRFMNYFTNSKPLINNKGAHFRSDDNSLHYHNLSGNGNIYNINILFCTWYDNAIAEYADITAYINQRYCDKYGYANFIADHKRRVPHMEPTWERFPLLLALMEKKPHYQYLMWIDADACFNNKSQYTVENFIQNNPHKDFYFSADMDKKYPINAGVIIIRNNNYTKKMLNIFLNSRDDVINSQYSKYILDQAAITKAYLENINNLKRQSVIIPYGKLQYFAKDKKCKKNALIVHAAGESTADRIKFFKNLVSSI